MTTTVQPPAGVSPPGASPESSPSPPAVPARGGTRWRRAGLLLLPALIGVGVLAVATLQGVLPLNLVVSGQEFKLASNGGRVQVPRGLTMYPSTIRLKNGGETRGVVIAGLPEADLQKGMCISLVLTFPVVGTYTLRLRTSGRTVAKDMTLDASGVQAGETNLVPRTSDGKAGNGHNVLLPVTLGKTSGDLQGVDAPAGRYGIEAPGNGYLTALRADAQGAIIAGTAKLSGLGVAVHSGRGVGNGECY